MNIETIVLSLLALTAPFVGTVAGADTRMVDGEMIVSGGLRGGTDLAANAFASETEQDEPDCETTSTDDEYIYKVFPPQPPICRDAQKDLSYWQRRTYTEKDFGVGWEFFNLTDATSTNDALVDYQWGTWYLYFMNDQPLNLTSDEVEEWGQRNPCGQFLSSTEYKNKRDCNAVRLAMRKKISDS